MPIARGGLFHIFYLRWKYDLNIKEIWSIKSFVTMLCIPDTFYCAWFIVYNFEIWILFLNKLLVKWLFPWRVAAVPVGLNDVQFSRKQAFHFPSITIRNFKRCQKNSTSRKTIKTTTMMLLSAVGLLQYLCV